MYQWANGGITNEGFWDIEYKYSEARKNSYLQRGQNLIPLQVLILLFIPIRVKFNLTELNDITFVQYYVSLWLTPIKIILKSELVFVQRLHFRRLFLWQLHFIVDWFWWNCICILCIQKNPDVVNLVTISWLIIKISQ